MPSWHHIGCFDRVLIYELGVPPGRPSARAYVCAEPDGLRIVGISGDATARELAALEAAVHLDVHERFAATSTGGQPFTEVLRFFRIKPTTSIKHNRGRKTKWTDERLIAFEQKYLADGETGGLGGRQTREVLRRAKAIRAKPSEPVLSWDEVERRWFELRRRADEFERNWRRREQGGRRALQPRRRLQLDDFRDSLPAPGDGRCGHVWKGLVCNLRAGHAGLHAELAAGVR